MLKDAFCEILSFNNVVIYLLQFYLLSVVRREGHHEDSDWPYGGG